MRKLFIFPTFLLSLSLGARPSVLSRKRKADNEDSGTIQKERKKRKTHINKTPPPPEINVIDDDNDSDALLVYVDKVPDPVDPAHGHHDIEVHPQSRDSLPESESSVPPNLSTSLSPLPAPASLSPPVLSTPTLSTIVLSVPPLSSIFPPSSTSPPPTQTPENDDGNSVQPSPCPDNQPTVVSSLPPVCFFF